MDKKEFLMEVVKLLSKYKIDIIPIKFNNKDSDLDIVVLQKKNYKKAWNILEKNGFQLIKTISYLREPEKRLFKSKRCPFKVHLHSMISWNGIEYLSIKNVWQRRIIKDGLFFPSKEDDILIMAAHSVFENKLIVKEDIEYFSKLIQNKLNWDYMYESAKEYNWLCAFKLFIKYAKIKKRRYSLKDLIKCSMDKLFLDVWDGKFYQLPQQLFSYTIIDYLWCYRNAIRRKK